VTKIFLRSLKNVGTDNLALSRHQLTLELMHHAVCTFTAHV